MIQDFPYRNLHHYLEVHDLLNAGEAILEAAKKQYLKLYQRAYRSKSVKHQLNVLLDDEDHNYLKKKAKESGLKKATQYLLHLIGSDRNGVHTKPNLLIDIEVGILKTLDGLSKKMGSSNEQRVNLIDTYRQLEEMLLILTK